MLFKRRLLSNMLLISSGPLKNLLVEQQFMSIDGWFM
jgi:hypothetical protein